MPTYRAMQKTKKGGGGFTLVLLVLGVVVTLLGLSYRRTHTAADGGTRSVPARQTSAPTQATPGGATTPSHSSSGDRNG